MNLIVLSRNPFTTTQMKFDPDFIDTHQFNMDLRLKVKPEL